MGRIFLSAPHLCGKEQEFLADAIASNWIAPTGPHVDAFEREFAKLVDMPYAAALSSGTAALHLALNMLDVQQGDEVIVSDLTFSASVNAIAYQRAQPVLIDCNKGTWNIDPDLLEEELVSAAKRGKLPKAAIIVDIYGQSADHDPIGLACERFGVPIIEDVAEALGATYKGRPTGRFGRIGTFSFNGNKIITTSGGGMLVSFDESLVKRARYLSCQARDPAPHYEHSTIGYNYRLSNLLAALGRGQLTVLNERVEKRRQVFAWYQELLGDLPGLSFMPEASYGRCTRWLTCVLIEPKEFGATREQIRLGLEEHNIEARPVWKPMHMQPVFSGCRVRGGAVDESLFEKGLCIPSSSSLSRSDVESIAEIIRNARR